jgi:hypothetical protein
MLHGYCRRAMCIGTPPISVLHNVAALHCRRLHDTGAPRRRRRRASPATRRRRRPSQRECPPSSTGWCYRFRQQSPSPYPSPADARFRSSNFLARYLNLTVRPATFERNVRPFVRATPRFTQTSVRGMHSISTALPRSHASLHRAWEQSIPPTRPHSKTRHVKRTRKDV